MYVYHGSQYRLDELIPQKACGKNCNESMLGIYAAETFDEVIPFALPIRWYPDNPTGRRDFECNSGKVYIKYGSLNPNGVGYIYKLNALEFKKIDEWQWICQKKIIPIERYEIKVSDYWNIVTFSEDAQKINNELFVMNNY